MNPTIRDVAKLANTSKSTVSRYLNGQSVKKETAEALRKAIQELNFHPNANARQLVLNKTQVIGIIVDDITNMFYAGVIRGIERVARNHGYNCIFLSATSNYKNETSYLDLLYGGQVDGIILISFRKRSAEELERMKDVPFPIVLVGDVGQEEGIPSVDVDNSAGVADVVHYLHRIGHSRIAYISGPDSLAATQYRLQGYRAAIDDLGLESREEWIADSDWSNAGGHAAMRRLMETGGFTAVAASNDETAIGALRAAQEHGYAVPNDLSVVGFDDIPVAGWVYPALTTVRQPFAEMGAKAAEALFDQVNGSKQQTSSRTLLRPQLVIRNSCRKL